jgi:hypothetical protein
MSQNAETKIQNAALLAVGSRPDVLAMRLQSGTFRAMDDPQRLVKIGQPGVADTMMFVQVEITADMIGKRIAVPVAAEFKTPTGRQSASQIAWQRAFEARGGIYTLARSPDDLVGAVNRVQRGEF